MWNKIHSFLINTLMDILCILISNWDYPKEWDNEGLQVWGERDLMVQLSRKLMKEGNESKFVIVPLWQWKCMAKKGLICPTK